MTRPDPTNHQAADRAAHDFKGGLVMERTVTCVHCGSAVTRSGPETFHAETTMIRCANAEGTRATAADSVASVLKEMA